MVRSEVNGSLLVVFVWMFDVFFGPAMGGTGAILRLFPLHFPTLVVTDVASGHAGPLGDVGISALWAIAARYQLPGGWPALYEANRDVVGEDPDLIYPGQIFDLPEADGSE